MNSFINRSRITCQGRPVYIYNYLREEGRQTSVCVISSNDLLNRSEANKSSVRGGRDTSV